MLGSEQTPQHVTGSSHQSTVVQPIGTECTEDMQGTRGSDSGPKEPSSSNPTTETSMPHKRKRGSEDHPPDVVRISRSCDACKARKVKCNGRKPSCAYCAKNGVDCVYSPMKKPGLQPGFGKKYSERLDRLEVTLSSHDGEISSLKNQIASLKNNYSQLQLSFSNANSFQFQPSMNVNTYGITADSATRTSTDPVSPLSIQVPVIQSAKNSPYYDDNSFPWPGLPSVSTVRYMVNIFFKKIHPHLPFLHPAHTIHSLFTKPNPAKHSRSHSPNNAINNSEFVLYGILLCSLRYIDASAENETLYKFLKEKIILLCYKVENIQQLQALTLLALDLYGTSNGPDLWSILSLLCAGVIQLQLCKEKLHSKKNYENRFSSGPDHELKKSSHKTIATISAKLLGAPDSWVEHESRRRLFWSIFILDRLSAVATSFPFKLPTSEVDKLLPVKMKIWLNNDSNEYQNQSPSVASSSPVNIPLPSQTRWLRTQSHPNVILTGTEDDTYDSFSYYVELVHILGKIHEFLRIPVDILKVDEVMNWQMTFCKLDNEIREWKTTLTPKYQSLLDNDNFEQFFYTIPDNGNVNGTMKECDDPYIDKLHSLYHTTIIRLNSSAAYPNARSELFLPSNTARERCLESTSKIINVVKTLEPSNLDGPWIKDSPQYAFSLWVTARLLLVDCVMNGNPFPDDLNTLIKALFSIGVSWPSSVKFAKILSFVLNEEDKSKNKNTTFTLQKSNDLDHNKNESKSNNSDDEDEDINDDEGIIDITENSKNNIIDRSHPSSTRILSDMRHNAYTLDFILSKKMSRSEPSSGGVKPSPKLPSQNQPSLPTTISYPDTNIPTSLNQFGQNVVATPSPYNTTGLPSFDSSVNLENIFEWFKFPKSLNTNEELGSYGIANANDSVDYYLKNISDIKSLGLTPDNNQQFQYQKMAGPSNSDLNGNINVNQEPEDIHNHNKRTLTPGFYQHNLWNSRRSSQDWLINNQTNPNNKAQ